MKLKKTVWIPLVCAPVLLTAAIVPPVVIYKNKQKVTKPSENPKKPEENQPKKPTPQPKKPIDELKPIIDPNITTLNKQLKEASNSLNSTLSNKKYKNLEKLQSEISAHLTNNNNSFNNISFEITNKSSLPERGRNQTVNLNLKATGLNNKSSSLSTTLNNVSLGILDIDEIISRKKMWVEIKELESFKNNTYPDQVKEDFFYLLKKNNYDNLDESIFNKDSYTYDFSKTEVKNVNVDYGTKREGGNDYYYKKTRFIDMEPTESWYKTKMKIKKNQTKDDFVDWNNKDELEFTLYVFISKLYDSNGYFNNKVEGNDGAFVIIDKNGNEERVNLEELKKPDSNTWLSSYYDYDNWKKQKLIVEECVSWKNIYGTISFPETIKRVPKFLPSLIWSLEVRFYWATKFNQDISTWDVSKVTNMSDMFYNATSFNQDLSKWDVSKVWESKQNLGYSNSNWKKEHRPQFNKNNS
ncbi:BspA family leucine-rich repeat surface protein [Mycoplasma leachii]|uniref:BspA family leucine-rich repeat surface protein n=1 Tax=Mycoplasma leachii TaxID=2105 RepID=UPI003DA4B648